ncbi:MAG TPA: HD domain-containing phosphohydrolase, partial [Gammaproteobacteria bacterium]|nr:HD domain-containing phosphohydrolase [Gammaproteobacteria bacterium]
RIVGLVAVGLVAVGVLQLLYSEHVLEEAILDQTKRQAAVFLRGVEREVQDRPEPLARQGLRELLLRAVRNDHGYSEFSVLQAYIYDREGNVLAHTEPGEHPPREMSGYYADVVRRGVPYMGSEVEQYRDPTTGEVTAATDVIIPLHVDDAVVGGIEVELDLGRTMQTVRQLDDRYELYLTGMLVTAGFALLGLVSWVIYRGLVIPVRHLGDATGRIAEGALTTRVQERGADELRGLGQSINKMADNIQRLFNEQEKAYLGSLQSLMKALETKDAYTASHSGRVTHFSLLLGRRVGVAEKDLELLKQGALMHDLGKIGIPDAILNKPGPLDDAEYEEMKKHPVYTYEIMKPLRSFRVFSDVARWHHERWDGAGYPDGLRGEEIPLLARIVAIADTWDAMTGDRVYRKGMPVDKALSILQSERDAGQWDPHLLDQFIEVVREGHEARRQTREDMLGA